MRHRGEDLFAAMHLAAALLMRNTRHFIPFSPAVYPGVG